VANESQLDFFFKTETPPVHGDFTAFPPHFDASGYFIHPCDVCGAPASLGYGVSLRRAQLGRWRCPDHPMQKEDPK